MRDIEPEYVLTIDDADAALRDIFAKLRARGYTVDDSLPDSLTITPPKPRPHIDDDRDYISPPRQSPPERRGVSGGPLGGE